MSIAITRADIKGYFNSGDVPSEANFHAFIDSMVMKYEVSQTITANTDLTITHGNDTKATHVTVLNGDNEAVEISWKRTPLNEANAVTINAGFDVPNAVIIVHC